MISFFRGHPTDNMLPVEQVAKAMSNVLLNPQQYWDNDANRHPLQYGPDEGSYEVRKTFAEFSNRTLQCTATPECINLTNGASYGAASALLLLTGPNTRKAFIVSPTYFLINTVFENAGFKNRMVAIPETSEIDLELLESVLEEDSEGINFQQETSKQGGQKTHSYTYVMYLVPTFSNPGGQTVSLKQREKLIELARKYNMLLLCDEVYEWLNFNESIHPPLLVTLDRETLVPGTQGNVVANYSMSKVLGPGLRVGWQETATPHLAHHLSQSGAIVSGGTPAHLSTYAVANLMRSGEVDKILNGLNATYRDRAVQYLKVMQEKFPRGTKIEGGDGGYFFWLRLPDGYNIPEITRLCKQEGIVVAPGECFEVSGDPKGWGDNCFRVSLSYFDNEQALPALSKWAEIISSCKSN